MLNDSRYVLDKVEFYITNVCNLNCDQCNRFNDYKFAGWQRWSDYEAIHQRWAELVDITVASDSFHCGCTVLSYEVCIAYKS